MDQLQEKGGGERERQTESRWPFCFLFIPSSLLCIAQNSGSLPGVSHTCDLRSVAVKGPSGGFLGLFAFRRQGRGCGG